MYGVQPRLLIGRDTFHATTIPDICTLKTQPIPVVIDLCAIDTQPVPVAKPRSIRTARERERYPRQMLWWSLLSLAIGFAALWGWSDAVWFLACEVIGFVCACLWLIDMLICCLFR